MFHEHGGIARFGGDAGDCSCYRLIDNKIGEIASRVPNLYKRPIVVSVSWRVWERDRGRPGCIAADRYQSPEIPGESVMLLCFLFLNNRLSSPSESQLVTHAKHGEELLEFTASHHSKVPAGCPGLREAESQGRSGRILAQGAPARLADNLDWRIA